MSLMEGYHVANTNGRDTHGSLLQPMTGQHCVAQSRNYYTGRNIDNILTCVAQSKN